MRINHLPRPLNFDNFEGNHQLRLPFADPMPQGPGGPVTTVHELDVCDRRGRSYELLVSQDPRTRCVLSYRIRYCPVH
jgi:hypothetical protein